MWVVNTETLQLEEVYDDDGCEYAILSHRWEKDEVLFEDMKELSTCSKNGVQKLESACELARAYHFGHIWIDTCCIDKKSSAELSEAINSMFRWYKDAKRCFVFLNDVSVTTDHPAFERQFRNSAWFTRSWTLQELIAPRERLVFFNAHWTKLGNKFELLQLVSDITRIDAAALTDGRLSDYSIAERMGWAARRHASRVEDLAYSLMGIFDINMPMLYGEGSKAFRRLQEQVCNDSDDETIFAWSVPPDEPESDPKTGLLAPSPSAFEYCQGLKPISLHNQESGFTLTNRGLTSKLMLAVYRPWHQSRLSFLHPHMDPSSSEDTSLAFLNATFASTPVDQFVGIFLRRAGTAPHNYVRVFGGSLENPIWLWKGSYADVWCWKPRLEHIAVRHKGFSKPAILPRLVGVELSQLLGDGSLLPTNPAFRGAKLHLAPGASLVETANRVTQSDRNRFRPICTIEMDGTFNNILWIYLGLLDTNQPFCIIIDNKFATRPDINTTTAKRSSKSERSGSHGVRLPTLDDILTFQVNEVQIPWTLFNEDSKMSPQQTYTGFWAIKGNTSGSSEWTCLQPSWLGAPYKNRGSWTVRFKPYHESYHELWQFEIESC